MTRATYKFIHQQTLHVCHSAFFSQSKVKKRISDHKLILGSFTKCTFYERIAPPFQNEENSSTLFDDNPLAPIKQNKISILYHL